ncbi:Glycosyl transferase, family 1 [Penicillium griseofulvum]|uniref:Glycosyl transferase, family 1 n=1 Tax=Penicillium patulum TaxID=5078 RepID=A0A135LIH6_PENPA|nr:Glycosyl transferase, family 1 [Penicillium griseofulvum]KXG48776.1 Glycosyl transferase, family 1 [Penicillium griseofulvum]
MPGVGHKFERQASVTQQRRLSLQFERNAWLGPPSNTIYAGISGKFDDHGTSTIAIAVRDTTYLLDFIEKEFSDSHASEDEVIEFIISKSKQYTMDHMEKLIGISMPEDVARHCPRLCPRLWAELDIVPLVLSNVSLIDRMSVEQVGEPQTQPINGWDAKTIDEQAESMARKGVRLFGPENTPLLQVGFLGLVEVDTAFHVRLADLSDFKKTVSDRTWSAVQHYATDLKERKVKVAFFSATPQGGGVALMRHALMRFSHCLGTDMKWYVPKPRPGVFRITKTNHNILQGVAHKSERLTPQNKKLLQEWIEENARRYWTRLGGPLLPPSEGGADVIVIDDPQMPGLIPIAKALAPDRPIIFRSHIQIRSDLVAIPGSPQAEAWEFLWDSIKHADCFISHPVSAFVPRNVPADMVGYMPASTDWLDGLNKNMRDWDVAHYGRIFNSACRNADMPTIQWPEDSYIVQIARFDPSKGIVDVLVSYEKFYNKLVAEVPHVVPPKLLICGHGSVDDPDGAEIYDATIDYVDRKIPDIRHLICVMRVRPCDQVLNAILSKATVALQLSTSEGFEVKVSEAIHKGKPVIATRAGGIPLQVTNGKNGFLVDVGDTDAVAQHLFELWTDQDLYNRMSEYGINNVSDEVSTVGNALDWLYLCTKLSRGEPVRPNGRWIDDMAFEEIGLPQKDSELRLTRAVKVENMG